MKKTLLALGLLFMCLEATAQDSNSSNEDKFEERKAKLLERMSATQTCIKKASSREELKECRPKKREKFSRKKFSEN